VLLFTHTSPGPPPGAAVAAGPLDFVALGKDFVDAAAGAAGAAGLAAAGVAAAAGAAAAGAAALPLEPADPYHVCTP
jgi:hypothetical protein